MDTYDLDDTPAADPGRRPGTDRRAARWRWWAVLVVVLIIVSAAVATGVDQRSRTREFAALLAQVTQAQSSIRYSDAQIQSMVQYTSPQLTSSRAPAAVRAGLRKLVQQAAAERVAPTRARRDAVAALPVARRHADLRRARRAYLAYVDQRLTVLQAMAVDLRVLYRPQPQSHRLRVSARSALLAASPDAASSARIRDLFR